MFKDEFTLNVIPATKKNHGEIIHARNGAHIMLPSKAYRRFEKECLDIIEDKHRVEIDFPINAQCIFYMPTRRIVDLTNLLNAIMDTLVKARVLKDDNSRIVQSHDGSRVMYDKENPRIEILLEERKDNVSSN